jgi:ribosomal protein S18 acetylase RimI-like enzyme
MIQYREAEAADAEPIAALHADSWRRHYRGALADSFLDGDVVADRLAVWTSRLRQPSPGSATVVAVDSGSLVGFAHVIFDDDPTWGALLDNLHVAVGQQRRGIGARLLELSAGYVRGGMYLWVLEQNVSAQSFYKACKGEWVETDLMPPPEGVPGRLHGSPRRMRFVWRSVLS